MSERDGVVGQLAAAIADGEPVEWQNVDGLATTPNDRAIVKQLVAIAAFDRGRTRRDHFSLGTDIAASSGLWRAVLALAVVQILVAVSTLYFVAQLTLASTAKYQLAYRGAICLAFSTGALFLIRGGYRDGRARHLGHAYVLGAAAFTHSFIELSITHGWLPYATILRGINPEAFLPVAVWRFAAGFPRVRRFTRMARLSSLATTAALLTGVVFFIVSAASVWWPALLTTAPWLSTLRRAGTSLTFWLVSCSLMLAAISFSLSRVHASEREERLRAMWFLLALAIGVLPLFGQALLRRLYPEFWSETSPGPLQTAIDVVSLLGIVSVPLTTAYAVLVHHVLNVRLVIHHTLRHALAKYTLSGLIAVPTLIPLRLAYMHRDWRIDDVISDPRSLFAAGLMLTGLVLLALRGRLIAGLDRMFLGHHLDHATALAGATTAIGRGRTPREVAFEAAHRLARALGVSQVTIMQRTGASSFLPIHGTAPEMPQETALLAILSKTPAVALGRDSPLFELLPAEDRDWLTRCDFEVLAGVPSSDRDIAGIVGIGPRAGGVPFLKNDLSFVGAVIATAGLALSRPWSDEDGSRRLSEIDLGAVECDRCGAVGDAASCSCVGVRRPARLPLVLANKFAVLKRLGQGGMGVVYLGRDMHLDRRVALKTLPDVSPDAAAAMLVEARTMAQVEHANLALIYALETWRSTPVLVVEYLGGGTLADRLDAGPLPIPEAVTIGTAVADGLAALHTSGILHRDIKPSNIGFTSAGIPKLLDFGVARLLSHLSSGVDSFAVQDPNGRSLSNTAIAGTPLYLSPESLNGEPATVSTDLWSTGVVLLEAIIGEYPFRGRSRAEALARVAAGEPDWDRARRQLAPAAVDLFERMFSRTISERPQTAGELAAMLRTLSAQS